MSFRSTACYQVGAGVFEASTSWEELNGMIE